MQVTIKDRPTGFIVWYGEYASVAAAKAAYRNDLDAEAYDYDAVDPDWMDDLVIETK